MVEKNYDVLVKDRLYFGGAKDAEAAFDNEAVDMVIDVRVNGLTDEEQEAIGYMYKHLPIVEEEQAVAASIDTVTKEITAAYHAGKKVYFHCGSGGGRAGVAATAVLMELGLAASLEEAESAVKEVRPQVTIRPNMAVALRELYK
ncbi:protein-tyrosine phosphatase family protein [Lysinibacillus contaminans]|uniref:protein-tyrosine phosphatase family protein n=1 Tax=Lysinibacillus contaminans TaxID=1293441 RepID=UPI000AECBECB|nr:dual specificity protein phosphatase family protein [Lysinibacillus contaminans]